MDGDTGKQSSQIQNVVWCVTEFVFTRDGQRGRPPPPETELELEKLLIYDHLKYLVCEVWFGNFF